MVKLWIAVFATVALSFVAGLPIEDLIRPNTPENIEKLKNLDKDDIAELYSGQYQGDMILTDEEIQELETGKSSKTGLIAARYRWENNEVPYRVTEAHFTAAQIAHIHLGARMIADVTCLRFVPYNPSVHSDFITVRGSGSGCSSSVGRRGTGEQFLNLQPNTVEVGCFRIGTVMHEFIHAIGFYHMQSATERDDYVRIVWDKIQAGTENNFNTYAASVITNHGVEYDYGSVMHYSRTAFSTDGSDTIVALRPLNGAVMGQRLEMSASDILRINRHYCDV